MNKFILRPIGLFLLFFLPIQLFSQIDLMDYSGNWFAQHSPVSNSNTVNELVDNNNATYLSVAQPATSVVYRAYSPFSIKTYTLTSASTASNFDPTSWTLQGSKDSVHWVQMDAQSGQSFASRGLKKSYSIATDSMFTYFRLSVSNANANTINLAEWELQLSSAWNGFVFPTINLIDIGTGTTTGEKVFFQALNNIKKVQQVCLGVNHLLYHSNSEVPAFTTLNLIIDTNNTGIAGKSGAAPAITIDYGPAYLSSVYNSRGLDGVLTEILGVMYHETTHAYTQAPPNSGAYSNGTNQHSFVEGIADYVRYKAGYIPISFRGPDSWYWGYKPAAFFIDWLNSKNPNFSYLFNLTSRDATMSPWSWDKATRQILGAGVDGLWREYQVYLKSLGNSNLVAEYVLDNRTIAVNAPVTFKNLSANANSYSWSFPGGTPSTSTATNPSVSYAQPGVYNVILTANGSSGSATKADSGYVIVGLLNAAQFYGIIANNTPVSLETGQTATDALYTTKVLMKDTTNTFMACYGYTPNVLKAYVFQGNGLNDSPPRFPNYWRLSGSNDNLSWTVIDRQSNKTHPNADFGRMPFNLPNNNTAFTYYKIDSMSNLINGGTSDYLALSEVELYTTSIDSTIKDLTDDGGLLTAQYQTGSPVGEDYTKLTDNDNTTKFFTNNCAVWVQYQATNNYVINSYRLVSGSDNPGRDPKNWTFLASNDGTTWVILDTKTNETFANRNAEQRYSVSTSSAYKYFMFNFTCNSGTDFQLSEIRIFGVPGNTTTNCNPPTNLTATSITNTSGILNWTGVSGSLGYDIDYQIAGATTWTNAITGTTNTNVSLTGLTSGTNYSYRVRNKCSSTSNSPYSVASFTTTGTAPCTLPSSVSTSNITASGATVSWPVVSGNLGYDVDYQIAGATSWINAVTATTASSFTISGLTSGTNYNVRVRTLCNTGYSAYTSSVSFTTNTVASGFLDITDDGGLLTVQYQDSPTGEGYLNAIDNNVGTKYLTFHCAAWVQYQAKNNYIVQSYSLFSANDEPTRDPKNWTFQGSVDGVNWVTLDTRTNQVFANRFQENVYTVTGNTSAFNYYRFNFNCNGASIFQIGEIKINGTQSTNTTCIAPTIASSGTTSSSTVLNWSTSASLINYDVDYKTNAATTWTNAVTGSTSSSITLSGLNPNTGYSARIRAKCTNGTYTLYSTVAFTTNSIANNLVDITDDGGKVYAQYQTGSPTGEGYTNLTDNNVNTKYLTFNCAAWIMYKAAHSYIVTSYSITSANDEPTRDPKNWTFQGSNDSLNWVTLNTQSNQVFANRFQENTYSFTNSTAYKYYKVNITCNGASIMQLAELRIFGSLVAGTGTVTNIPAEDAIGQNIYKVVAYPNPVSNILTIDIDKGKPEMLQVFDATGKLVLSQKLNGALKNTINVRNLSAGIYQVVLISSDKTNNRFKILKAE